MGGKYRITGDKYPRMRRRRRRGRLVVVVVACGAVLGVAGWGTLQLIDVFTGGGGTASAAGSRASCGVKSAKASPSASASPAVLPKPAQITVNVLNATTRSGLAKTTADELEKRGFKIGEVGNASKEFDKKVTGAGILVGPAASLNTSLPVLSTQLAGAERRTDAARKGAEVDLIIGNGFKALSSEADAAKALAALAEPKPTATTKNAC
ncbi:LytR C-terminal domain-containing protein [Streptomyces sp. NPDC096132]|uniref:LytR C-terminal domain-containing protein n=1 Tax=Streptomyces sp. NPDC096132 TaxID=3366075 RepID=UPI00382500BB